MIFDHLGIVVKNLSRARSNIALMLGIEQWSAEFTDSVNGVNLQFGRDASGICYELLEPLGPASPVATALNEKRAILNHVAYRVANLADSAAHLQRCGCARTSDPKPAIAYNGCRIQFFVTSMRFIIELIEAPEHEHKFLRSVFVESEAQSESSI